MLETLFKVPPAALADARLEFAVPLPLLALLALLGIAGALALGGYLDRALPRERRRAPGWLRGGLALLAVLALARPAVVVPAPGEGGAPVAILVDDSSSMGVGDGAAASEAVALLAPGDGSLAREVAARFTVRHHRFAATLSDAAAPGAPFRGAVSDPLGALLEAAAGGRLAGLVLASDGGQVSTRDVDDALTRLRASGVPVHVVGLGAAAPQPDVAVAAVSVAPLALEGDTVDLTAWLRAAGLEGERVDVTVRDAGVLVAEGATVVDGGRASVRLAVTLSEPGLRALEVEARIAGGDRVAQNDVARRLVQVRREPARVLHVEGEPRFEVKFLRRAVTADPAIALSSLVRTGDNRFLRLGVRDADELAEGFPASADALFRYDVLVLGSVQAAALGEAALALLEDYVARRGASVVFLGGRNAFSEGGFHDTRVAGLLPVSLGPPAPQFRVAAAAVLTREGLSHPVTRDLPALLDPQRRLPELAVVNPVRRAKAGASVLMEGIDGGADPVALLAWHRFGAGRVAVLPARDTWRWRMHADVPVDDRTHELFWRRLLRWMARDVARPVTVTAEPAVAAPGQVVTLRAQVRDPSWRALSDLAPRVLLTTPLGEIRERSMTWTAGDGADGGSYLARYTADEAGVHELEVRASLPGGESLGGAGGLLIDAAGEEFRATGLDEALLERIARETGGSYRRGAQAAGLAERVAASVPAAESWRRVELWNAPALLLAMLALAAGEWWLRRRRRELP